MKAKVLFLLSLLSISAFANENEMQNKFSETKEKQNFTYVKLITGNNDFNKDFLVVPSLSIGRRFGSTEKQAVDVSGSIAYRETEEIINNERIEQKYWSLSLPRILYLRYFSPAKEHSLFWGVGGSWVGISSEKDKSDPENPFSRYETLEENEFWGIAANATIGYEFGRNQRVKQLLQIDVTQPVFGATQEGKFPLPVIECSVGLGF